MRTVGGQLVRAPIARETWAELAYVIVGAPLALLGVAYILVCGLLGAGLAITALGIPILAMAIPAARWFGRMRRGLVRTLLGESVPAPAAFHAGRGLFARTSAGLRDTPGWRAVAYLMAGLPVTLLGLSAVLVTWAWGLIALTYPLQHALGVNQLTVRDADGVIRQGFLFGGLVLDTYPRLLLVSAGGVVLLLLAPWAVRAVVLLDRLLVRSLLGPDGAAQRIADLRRTRALAVDDAAATLRRIERDLHDGVQASLVALGMNLTMIAETLDGDASEATRSLLATAQTTAKDAIRELRDVVRSIHPPALDDGLDTAIATLIARGPIPVSLHMDITQRPSPAIETIAYFCVAELFTNVIKHSGADHATVEISQRDGHLRVRVSDNGHGGAHLHGGSGLRGLLDRVAIVDGTVDLVSPPAGPTVVTINLPAQP
ncbi:MAG TPA: sensor domain-containing protein [Micromonosporaceae bacterium]|nr:sensor domain-containing protein [Micromonosporaceae bacterium]